MPDTVYATEDYATIPISSVSVAIGDPGSPTLSTLGTPGSYLILTPDPAPSGFASTMTDVDSDGLGVGGDFWFTSSWEYTGYTFTAGGVEMPVFKSTTSFFIVGPTAAINALEAGDISSQYAAEAPSGTYLCFAEGTAISTPGGACPVEGLQRGDTVLTADGAMTEVRWVGRQTVARTFADPARQVLVEIKAGALGSGLPLRDLRVTADHALLIDGLLVNAGALINGGGIDWVAQADLPGTYTIYHVETEAHEVILAKGVAADTLIDYAGRARFDNFGECLTLDGHERVIAEARYPRVTAARQIPPAMRLRIGLTRAT